jgi:hypothetical protein
LEDLYSAGDVAKVAANDEDRVPQAGTDQYLIHEFKDFVGAATQWSLEWEGQSTQSTATSKVVLQIWDIDGTTWADVDEENGVGANTDFILSGSITSVADHYKDTQNVITCRVYQKAL